MNYRVFWYPDAEHYFDALLKGSTEPKQLTSAAHEIDRQLANDPFAFSESRQGRIRIGFETPLAVYYEVLRDVNTVIVHDVWLTTSRSQ